MAKLGAQLKERRTRLRISQRELAGTTGIEQATISRIEKGDMLLVSPHLAPLAQALGIEIINPLGENDEPVVLQGAIIPAWSQSVAARCLGADEDEMEDCKPIQHIMSLKKHSARSFAVLIEDEANSPRLRPGHWLIADPNVDPKPGKFVVAGCNGEEKAFIARYAARVADSNGNPVFELIPDNPLFPSVRSDREELVIFGVGVEKYELDI